MPTQAATWSSPSARAAATTCLAPQCRRPWPALLQRSLHPLPPLQLEDSELHLGRLQVLLRLQTLASLQLQLQLLPATAAAPGTPAVRAAWATRSWQPTS